MKNNKGFAISGIMYAILIISLLLVLGTLKTIQNRKTIIDKVKSETVNALDSNNYQDLKEELENLKTRVIELEDKKTDLPIGTIIETTTAITPSDYFEGTWTQYTEGKGRTLVGIDTSSSYDWLKTVGQTYGEYVHQLTIDEMPSHNHTGSFFVCGYSGWSTTLDPGVYGIKQDSYVSPNTKNCTGVKSRAASVTGGGQNHNNVQPSITVYRYKRTS